MNSCIIKFYAMKNFTLGLKSTFTAAVLLSCMSAMNGQTTEVFHGNSTWESKSEYFPIVEENFLDWNYTDADGYGLKKPEVNSCATGVDIRGDYQNYSTWTVSRPIDSRQGLAADKKFAFYLDFCQIQPDCDTQSGTNYTSCPTCTGNDYLGASWTNVSKGCINIYDNYQNVRNPAEWSGVGGDGAGSITTSKISKLERVQYTVSSYGTARGFHLEIGYDMGDGTVYWDTLRYLPGNSMTYYRPAGEYPLTTSAKTFFKESNRGFVYEEKFDPDTYTNVYLRIRPTNSAHNRQIVRLHDFKIYGVMLGADAGVLPPVPTAINKNTSAWLKIYGSKGQYRLNIESNVQVMSVSGRLVRNLSKTSTVNISDMPSGVYILKVVSVDGKVASKKVVF
jgi:hypothetical protein